MRDPFWQSWDSAPALAPLAAVPAGLPDADKIPPREWLYGTALIRRFVSVLVAPGGVGKSALVLAQALALATGKNFMAEKVHHSVPAWVLNLEDPLEETERRLAALMIRHRIAREAVAGRMFLNSGRHRRVRMAVIGPDGFTIAYPDQAGVIETVKAHGIGLITVDPFVKSHTLDENSNAHMDAAATAWAEVAEATGAAVQLVHHTRKGGAEDAGVEAARGAKALTDAARVARVLSPMTLAEAEQLGVKPGERWRHVRLDDAKANLAPRAEKALWFRLDTVSLENKTVDYPQGDNVAAITPWHPAGVWTRLSPGDCNSALDRIAAGPPKVGNEGGGMYAALRRGHGAHRWAGHVLTAQFGLTDAQALEVITTWLRTGLLVEVEYRDAEQRKMRSGVRVVDALRPTASTHAGSEARGADYPGSEARGADHAAV